MADSLSLLMRFEDKDDHAVTFTDTLPPFGVLQIAPVTWETLGEPVEILVSVAPTTHPQNASERAHEVIGQLLYEGDNR